MTIPDPENPERPQEPDEPVDPEQRPVPESDRSGVEDYHVPDRDPEVPLTEDGEAVDPDEAYPHAQDVEEGRA